MPRPAQQIRFCESTDGVRIAYAVCGDGPPLVKVGHWITHVELDWDSHIWRPWLSPLARRHTLIRYDFRGCGMSDRHTGHLSFDRLVDDLYAVLAGPR